MSSVEIIQFALDTGAFCLASQPIVSLQNDTGHHEILLRSNTLNSSPASYIAFAENHGLMPVLDRWIISKALQQTQHSNQRFALNVSGQTIDDSTFVDWLIAEFESHSINPKRYSFELTETRSCCIENALRFCDVLRDLGCEFAIDDFGSRQSDFELLDSLHPQYLKIDGRRVASCLTNRRSAAIVKGIQFMANQLEIMTVAEWIETQDVLDYVRSIGCDYGQGFLFGKAAPLQDLSTAAIAS